MFDALQRRPCPNFCLSRATRVINAFGAGVAGADAVTMALLAISALLWEGKPMADTIDTIVMLLQLTVFIGEPFVEVNPESYEETLSVQSPPFVHRTGIFLMRILRSPIGDNDTNSNTWKRYTP